MLQRFKENALVQAVFSGLRPAAVGLIAAAGFGVIALALFNDAGAGWLPVPRWRECLLFALLSFLIYKFKKHPILYIAAAGLLGVALGF
jgi:chromate transporter